MRIGAAGMGVGGGGTEESRVYVWKISLQQLPPLQRCRCDPRVLQRLQGGGVLAERQREAAWPREERVRVRGREAVAVALGHVDERVREQHIPRRREL